MGNLRTLHRMVEAGVESLSTRLEELYLVLDDSDQFFTYYTSVPIDAVKIPVFTALRQLRLKFNAINAERYKSLEDLVLAYINYFILHCRASLEEFRLHASFWLDLDELAETLASATQLKRVYLPYAMEVDGAECAEILSEQCGSLIEVWNTHEEMSGGEEMGAWTRIERDMFGEKTFIEEDPITIKTF